MDVETVWNDVKICEGQIFYKIRGGGYTYTVCDDVIIVNGIKAGRITKSTLGKALDVPNPTPKKIELAGCWGPSYIYGIITDKRIRGF